MTNEQFELKFEPDNGGKKGGQDSGTAEIVQLLGESDFDYRMRKFAALKQKTTVQEAADTQEVIEAPAKPESATETMFGITFKRLTPEEQARKDAMDKRKDING